MLLVDILSKVSLVILIINVILYFTGFLRKDKAYKYFSIYLFCIAVIQVIMMVLASKSQNNHFLSTYYLVLRFVFLSLFFYHLLNNINPIKGKIVKFASATACIFMAIQYIVQPELYYVFNSLGFFITSVLLILYSVLYLYEMLSQKLPFYYVTIGIFVYLISSALIFASAASIVSFKDSVSMTIWIVNAALFILYQLLILWEWKKQFSIQKTKQS